MSITTKTQEIRNKIIDSLMRDDKGMTAVPTDGDSLSVLMEVMRDADRTELSLLKITSDNKNSESDREIALAMAAITASRKQNPFEATDLSVIEGELDTRGLANDSLLPEIMLTPGVTEIGISEESYDEFNARMEANQ